jgi:hypothetical protein
LGRRLWSDLYPATGTILDIRIITFRFPAIIPIAGLGLSHILRVVLFRKVLLNVYRRRCGHRDSGWIWIHGWIWIIRRSINWNAITKAIS